jgi:hypothetical protein
MKSSALLILLAATATASAEVAIVPERLSMDRYQKLKNEAPFAVKTPDVEPKEAKIDWAENYYLSGASKVTENGVEKDLVFINHKSGEAGFQLYGNEPGKDGIQIVKLDWHPENPVKTEVTLKKGNEFATLKRDQAAFAAAPLPQQPVAGGNRPMQPTGVPIPGATGAIRQPTGQPPRVQPQIPRPGNVIPAPQAAYPQAAAGTQPNQASDPRRRIRVINR